MTLPASDDFNRQDAETLGSNWYTSTGQVGIDTNRAYGWQYYGTNGGNSLAHWTADTFNNDQYAEATLVKASGNDMNAGPSVRGQATSGGGCISFQTDSSTHYIVRHATGSEWYSLISEGGSLDNGDRMRIEVSGNQYYAFVDDVGIFDISSSQFSSGRAGVSFWGELIGLFYLDDWEGGNLGGGTPVSANKPAYLKGAVNTTNNKPAYLKGGITTSNNKPAYLSGSQNTTSSNSAYTLGQDTATNNKPAYTQGSLTSTSNSPAYLEGGSGATETSSTTAAYTAGSQIDNSTIPAYLVGFDTLNTNLPAFLAGSISLNSNSPAYLSGSNTEVSNVSAFLSGNDTLSSNITAYLNSSDSLSSNILTYLAGSQTLDSNISAYLKSENSEISSFPAYLNGAIVGELDSSIPVYLLGIGQILIPNGDIGATGAWKNELEGSELYSSLDEQDPIDSDYVYLSGTPQENDYFEVALSNPAPGIPGAGDVTVRWRGKDQNNTNGIQATVELRQGNTVIASMIQTLAGSPTTYSFTLTPQEKNQITDWSDLRVRVKIS